MKSRTIAIAGSIAALTFAAAPAAALAAKQSPHRPATESRLDRSHDGTGLRHADKSVEKNSDRVDNSRDFGDR